MSTTLPSARSLMTAGLILLGAASSLHAEVSLPHIFSDHMVLQRGQKDPVWGKATPGESVTVTIDGQTHATTADAQGSWRVELEPINAGGPYTLTVSGTNTLRFTDVLVGEVWFCSGQSNMGWVVRKTDDAELDIASAHYPSIRLLSIPNVGTPTPQDDFKGQWGACTPESVTDFSAVGYLFGRRLYNTLNVPIGLIDNSWGGSSIEAWLPQKALDSDPLYDDIQANWDSILSAHTEEVHQKKIAEWKQQMHAWDDAGRKGPQPRHPEDPRSGQHRPSNIYNGMLFPTANYGMRGVIWYQGETNVSNATVYRSLFPLLIQTWRDLWQQGNFPFYWVQLADYRAESEEPQESAWAELREAQTMALSLPNTGEAVIIDQGEGRTIHPRNKQMVANRLARLALAQVYGYDMAAESPRYASMKINGDKILLTLSPVSSQGLYTFDTRTPVGFAVAGEDRKFVWAEARLVGKNQVEVWAEQVPHPVAVRYAWADNPVANLYDGNGLPVTPFRTDDWPGVTTQTRK